MKIRPLIVPTRYAFAMLVVALTPNWSYGQRYSVVERGAHYKVVQAPTGRNYMELADGMHYRKDRQWVESREEIELVDGGAIARQGQHTVAFAANLKALRSIVLTTPDGKRFASQVMGLAYYDSATGNSVLIAETKDSIGVLVAPNKVVYPDAMTDFLVDVQFTYRRGGFEQDVVLLEPLPSPAEYGLAPETTRLQVWTEFTERSAPEVEEFVLRAEEQADRRQQMVEPDFKDANLNFGVMGMLWR